MPSQLSSSTSTGLLERVQQRDADAWRRLAKLYSPLVYRWARQCGLQSNDAADVVQEVFAAVARNIDRFRHDQPQSSFRGWLWTIARNQVRLHFRRGKERPETMGGSDANYFFQQQPELVEREGEPAGFDSHASLVHRAIKLVRSDFQPQTWQAFWRLVVEGESATEIGADLGMSAAAVRQAKYRVLCRLQDELDQR
jgi:RNA polymerase sigma-70 factor (ECF subfamily)